MRIFTTNHTNDTNSLSVQSLLFVLVREVRGKFLFILLFQFSILNFSSCDLFSGARVDLLAKIDEEVAWANAEKLTNVAIIFPDGWGTSNPPPGTLTDTMDIRKGFPFNVEFSPTNDVEFLIWIPIEPDDGTGKTLNDRWTDHLWRNVPIVELPSNSRRRAAQVTVFTLDSFILLPLCNTVPVPVKTEPSMKHNEAPPMWTNLNKDEKDEWIVWWTKQKNIGDPPEYGTDEYKDFRIYFNINMDPLTVNFGNNEIKIDIVGETNSENFFNKPKWNNLYRCIVIEPQDIETLPKGKTITLTIGTEVTGYLTSESMMKVKENDDDPDEPMSVSFSWLVK